MNDRAAAPELDAAQAAVDAEHPWLGLASFTEETRAYFYGREEEIAELCRRVQRKLLTILFGQSGLGKTSILRAGVVPRLRPEGFCPVYVRIDYSPESPPPSEQIKLAIFKATQAQGQWTQVGVAEAGESLWEFLHHRDDVLRDASGKPLIPLLIFDQFEELFTLAQSDEFGRQRAAQFVEDLADLVENRAPKALEAKMDADDSAVEKFDFTRGDYRILIALREDYLAHLEGLKAAMPSIAQNRMRLARMTGAQALAAVLKPGGKLVSEEVAGAIVRFIAGGAELPNAEVEPALLSLICRELNNARIAQGRREISADLLAGSRDTILTDFYERALADQPPGVRQFIEDNLLTESGHRESLAEERVLKGLAAAGAKPDALATLVNRRLLRIEERLDVRRVELTHDVLCGVVKASRDVRLEREARDEAERKLAAQRDRERATRRALIRARQIAAGCAVLAVIAVGAAVFGYLSSKRAQEAEAKAIETRKLAESARSEAEKLIVFLLDDFYAELEPIGRLDIVAGLAKRAIDYYKGLPSELRTPETDRNRALALVRYGVVLRTQSKTDEAGPVLDDAISVLDKLRKDGDASEPTAIGLALALSAKARVAADTSTTETADLAQRAVDVLEPLMAGTPSRAVRRADAIALNYLGYTQMRLNDITKAVATLDRGRAVARSVDNLSLADLASAASFAELSAWQVEALRTLGRLDDARRVGGEGIALASKILDQQPGHMPALRARSLMSSALGQAETEQGMNNRRAAELQRSSVDDWKAFLKIDPSNGVALNNLSASYGNLSDALFRQGRVTEAMQSLQASVEARRGQTAPFHLPGMTIQAGFLAEAEAERGHRREAEAAASYAESIGKILSERFPEGSFRKAWSTSWVQRFHTTLIFLDEDYAGATRRLRERIAAVSAPPFTQEQRYDRFFILMQMERRLAMALYRQGEYAPAEAELRKAIDYRTNEIQPRNLEERREAMEDQTLLAALLARQGRQQDALAVIAPVLAFHRELASRHGDDQTQRVQMAQALYAAALADPSKAAPLLAEAAKLMDSLSPELQQLKTFALVRRDIAEAQGGRRG
jgi:tetratricopeptide (TPR) repeat protein